MKGETEHQISNYIMTFHLNLKYHKGFNRFKFSCIN